MQLILNMGGTPTKSMFSEAVPRVEKVLKEPKIVRIVCISDTHGHHDYLKNIPMGDILIHSGDFTHCGELSHVHKFNKFVSELGHPYKIVIAGNHDLTLGHKVLSEGLTNCIYLNNRGIIVHNLHIFGRGYNGVGYRHIPEQTDILITHEPPYGACDTHRPLDLSRRPCGSWSMRREVQNRIKPRLHVFGHIHNGGYMMEIEGIIFVNASITQEPIKHRKYMVVDLTSVI